jgi:hypothetical protein
VAYEYISNLAVYSRGPDTCRPRPISTLDTDTSIFDELMVARGVRWRFLSQKKLDYTQEYQVWVALVQREAAQQGPADPQREHPDVAGAGWPYVPAFNFPG